MSTAESTLVHANFSQYNQNGGSLKKKKVTVRYQSKYRSGVHTQGRKRCEHLYI